MKFIRSIIIATVLFTMTNCDSGSEPAPATTEEEKQINRLAKTWVTGTVTYVNDMITEEFEGFTLIIDKNKTYTTTGAMGDLDHKPFKGSGMWDFKDGNLNLLKRNDGVEMTVHVTDNTLELTFDMAEENGRVSGLGSYRFELIAR